MRAWHWMRPDGSLGYRDARVPKDGEKLIHKGSLLLCYSGLHASRCPLDALQFAPGPVICRVEMSGTYELGTDKLVASERTILWRADATDALRKFARLCALDVVYLWDAPDVVLRYLRTGDESLRTEAQSAAESAAWYAPWDAAESAARSANRSATRYAAGYAARAAAGYAARSAGRETQSRRLHRMLMKLGRGVKP